MYAHTVYDRLVTASQNDEREFNVHDELKLLANDPNIKTVYDFNRSDSRLLVVFDDQSAILLEANEKGVMLHLVKRVPDDTVRQIEMAQRLEYIWDYMTHETQRLENSDD